MSLPLVLDDNDDNDIADSDLVSLLNSLSKDLALRFWQLRLSSVVLIMLHTILRSALTFSMALACSFPRFGAMLLS